MSATTPGSLVPRDRPGGHLRELEGLRALAALAVLVTHAAFLSGATGRDLLPGFLARLDVGVAIFFVLSGFLLYGPHARRLVDGTPPATTRAYAVRRAARLVPAWLLVLAGTVVLVPESRSGHGDAWLANLLQVQSLRLEWDVPGLAQLWSLSTEVMFYAVLPATAALLLRLVGGRGPRAHLAALLVLAAGTWGFRVVVGVGLLPDGWSWLRTLPAVADWFVVGMVLAVVVADDRLRVPVSAVVRAAPWHLYGLAACVYWVVATRAAGPYDLAPPTAVEAGVKHLGFTLVAGLVVAPSVLGARTAVSRVLSSRVLVYGGTISYGVFLWHLPLMFRVRQVLGLDVFEWGFWVTVLLTLAVSVVVAALSWHLVEAPVQAWARHRTASERAARRPGPTAAPGAGERDEEQRQHA
ncbi:acyltransferase family protein [Phycicoccus avicenniae]|uniref:acyltransferase family protein n=1 Tax=Phycicoccus avicenniae TaxID=2828860 RepID=UPI0020124AF2|nr:acyltransferase [Phycicoccus avicenniae]